MLTTLPAQTIVNTHFIQTKQSESNGTIAIAFTNNSSNDIKLLKWNTPFEKNISANLFKIQEDTLNTVPYIGRLVKRNHPTDNDYLLFKPSQTHIATINLSRYYAMQKEGSYTIKYIGKLKLKSKVLQSELDASVKKKDVSMTIYYIPSQKKTLALNKQVANFNGCTQSNIDTLNLAHDEAIILANVAYNAMDNATPGTSGTRYVTWFGAPDNTRQTTVTTHFNNIYTALDTEQIVFDCTCTENYFAYVYPSQPYTIYLCNAFWPASLTGTDSKAGTLIHEVAHFNIVANTDDFAYGQTNAKALAISTPEDAVFNSDNHEYFAENTPYLAMENPFDTATVINDIIADLPLSDTIDVAGVEDYFKFTVSTSGTYTFYSTGTLDTIGTLYDINQNILISNDDENVSNLNFSLNYILTAGETYYISVQAYGNNTGAYSLNSSLEVCHHFIQGTNICKEGNPVATPQPWLPNPCQVGERLLQGTTNICQTTVTPQDIVFLPEKPLCSELQRPVQGLNVCI